MTHLPPEALLERIGAALRARPPVGISQDYLDSWLERRKPVLLALLRQQLRAHRLPETWSAGERTTANLEAMALAARGGPWTASEQEVLRGYSGWGGLSIEAVKHAFPPGIPAPETRGLIHEYYTPTRVTSEVSRVVAPLLPELAVDGTLTVLEPSAGIGRFVHALTQAAPSTRLHWLVVEYSELSGRMLAAMRPDIRVYQGPFERWVAEHEAQWKGRVQLVLANPPYGPRGAALTEDPVRSYREKKAYAYFLRRGLDLLAPRGLGVYLVPAGFLTGRSVAATTLRTKVLEHHHLAAAYRLPSGLFPGAMLVTDLLFFRARSGPTPIATADQAIVEGRYFEAFPEHILGTEVGREGGEDDQTRRPRWGYQVQGTFTGLPDLVERPLCATCTVPVPGSRPRVPPTAPQTRVSSTTKPLPPELELASSLGTRVDRYLAALARQEDESPADLWHELHEALTAWRTAHGNPWTHTGLAAQVKRGHPALLRFRSAYQRSGALVEGLDRPPVVKRHYRGRAGDVVALAEHLYRSRRHLTAGELLAAHQGQGGRLRTVAAVTTALVKAGWAVDGEDVVPMDDYLTGSLWPRYDRAKARAEQGDAVAEAQLGRLVGAMAPAVFDDIQGLSPRQGWVPLDLVSAWMSEALNSYYGRVTLQRKEGLVQVRGTSYDSVDGGRGLSHESGWFVGWLNHDKVLFKPKKRKGQNLDLVRLAKAREWEQGFAAWVAASEERKTAVEEAYNRAFKGHVLSSYSTDPLSIARWTDDIELHPFQAAAVRRLLSQRGGLLAFDVGLGKTYTALAMLARARQEGWVRRPVVLVPNSIVWKWVADVKRVLPDYRVAVIGSERKVLSRGKRKGLLTSVTDTPEDRASKWTRFQAGEFDLVLLTYSSLSRTRMNKGAVTAYAKATQAIRREVRLRQRNARNRNSALSERQRAILDEGVAAWVAERLELPASWKEDPGVAWDDLGIDLLIVDEAQNFKNLYLPEAREGGVPRFMGNAGEGAKRAWQLDFRAAAVRKHTGGSGIVLLSATPAKNSPLELYNLLQLVDHDLWQRMGITNPEQFIDRFLRIELKHVVDTKMDVVEKSAVTGFTNLHELRSVLHRFSEFRTADEVGLELPAPVVQTIEVEMSPQQVALYDRYVRLIEEALSPGARARERSKVLGLLARLSLIAVHPGLDKGSTSADPHSPKLDALARQILTNPHCGHIVFVDNVAAHEWAREVLVEAGIDRGRIAILNAVHAKASADRQRIARDFNGDEEEGLVPKYDVVVANAVAYEGIDLQTRTCAIHHLDLPWEPATLQQRNGRGVRQGNTLSSIEINYYFAKRSMDGLRFNLIQGKRGWMTELLTSQDRDTNNPGAQMDLGPEEMLLLVSRDPERTRERLERVKARREAEARARLAKSASSLLRQAHGRFRRAERTADPAEATRLRLEAEERLKDLAQMDTDAWPWAPWMGAVREAVVLIPAGGQAPVYEGLRLVQTNPLDPEHPTYIDLGRVKETSIGARQLGSPRWVEQTLDQVLSMGIRPEDLGPAWPEHDRAQTDEAMLGFLDRELTTYGGTWAKLGWTWASEAWLESTWPRWGWEVLTRLAGVASYLVKRQKVPVVDETGQLLLGQGTMLIRHEVLPPTAAGFQRFLELAPQHSELRFSELAAMAELWWDRKVPRTLLATRRSS